MRKMYSMLIKNSDLRRLIRKRIYDMNLGEKTLRNGDGKNYFMIVRFLAVLFSVDYSARDPVFLSSYF
jgi:hypothetical protein